MAESGAAERSAEERLESWRARTIGALARAIALVALPLAIWIAIDAWRLGLERATWAVLAFSVSSLACGLARVRPRVRTWWAIANFAVVVWITVPLAGAQAGVGSIIVLIAVLGALVLRPRHALLALAITIGLLLLWGILVVLGHVPRPPFRSSDAGAPWSALRSTIIAGSLGAIALFTTSYLIEKLTHTLFESERRVERQRAEMAAREEEARRRRKTEEELIRAQKLEALGRVAGGVAHDVNNNLTVALTAAELIERAANSDPRIRQLGASIREACENASILTRQLLALGRRELSRPEVIEVAAVLPRLERLLRTTIGRAIALRIAVPSDLPAVYVDPRQLEQVILNLAINARDALPGGGTITITADSGGPPPPYRVTTSDRAPEDAVRIHVSDDGLGIADRDLPVLFDFFFTTKGPDSGTGLGLAVARAFAEASGGRVGVRTKLGGGSTFTLELPSAKVEVARPKAPAKAPESATILVVEDDARVRAGMVAALAREGHLVLEAADGVEALERAESAPKIDLLCTDARMPRLGGDELIPRFSALHPNARVLVCSAYVNQESLRELIRTGHYAALPKPFSPAELREAVARALSDTSRPPVEGPARSGTGSLSREV